MDIVSGRLKVVLWIAIPINRTTYEVQLLYISWKTNFNCNRSLFDQWNYLFPCPVTNHIRLSSKTGNRLGGHSPIHAESQNVSSLMWIELIKIPCFHRPRNLAAIYTTSRHSILSEALYRVHISISRFPQDRGVQIAGVRAPWRLNLIRCRLIILGSQYGTCFISVFRRLIEGASGFLENLCTPALGPILILIKYNVLMSVPWDRRVIKY
jgi:hypothetical protein